jgi:hypothetical protein
MPIRQKSGGEPPFVADGSLVSTGPAPQNDIHNMWV